MALHSAAKLAAQFVKETNMKPMIKEKMEPRFGPDMQRHDEFISQHETETHKHHKHEFKKHAAGHKHHMDGVEAMCGGGMTKK